MRDEPMSPDELRMAKEALTQSLPGAFGTTSGAVSDYGDAYLHGLGLDYFLRYPPLVNAVTAAQALDAAKRYLKPEQLVVVAVGDRARIEPELRKLNIGPVRVLP
jgi:zinc protease